MQDQTFIVGRIDADQTVAAFLRVRLNLPWSKTKQLIESGKVRVAGQKTIDPAARLKLGKKVEVLGDASGKPKSTSPSAKTVRAKLPSAPEYDGPMPTIVYSDDSIVVVEKPAGLTTMRHDEEAAEFGERGKTFLPTTLADLLPAMLGRPGKPMRSVHRIDKDTSGLVVFARTKIAEDGLTEQFKAHSVERRYLGLVRGRPKSQTHESMFVRDRGDGRRGSGEGDDAQRAVTHVAVLEQYDGFAYITCRLETGRTHQVRIHLGEAGTPLCGETVYDRPLNGTPIADKSGAKRFMLHATRLALTHPVTEDRLTWDSTPPDDFLTLQTKLARKGKPAKADPDPDMEDGDEPDGDVTELSDWN
jgi:23S rRNA pseudouridine1911/1915/1917 synthase